MVMTARGYHEAVAHRRGRLSGLGIDWTNQPVPFKTYGGLSCVSLSRQAALPDVSLWDVLGAVGVGAMPGIDALSAVLFHAAGLTRTGVHKGGEFFYRACPSAGALYPCEVYMAWPGGLGLETGVYHFDVARHGLTLLRTGFPSPAGLGLPGRSALVGEAVLFVSAIFYRSAWKYRARAYRYLNLDAGHLCEGLALGLGAFGVAYRVELDFDDAAVSDLLGLDPEREGCLCAVRFRASQDSPLPLAAPGPLPKDAWQASRCAASDPTPLEVRAVHGACSHVPEHETAMPALAQSRLGSGLVWQDLSHLHGPSPRMSLFEAMSARRSRRAFVPVTLPRGTMSRVLSCLARPLYPGGAHPAEYACAVGVVAAQEAQAQPGFSLLDRVSVRTGLRRDGDMRSVMASVCLDQLWMREAAMQVVFCADLPEVEAHLGARGYRAALQGAGRLGHRLYLAAESLGLGACGVGAFFDGEAVETLGLPEGTGMLYAVAAGASRGSGSHVHG
ncbi:SagB family peptide dehydrogenase [Fundidesulfovibrio putealis]|uniref:SagB family peptide dehydrogenase n=1 Tax=Fundidesulfovibrio putealis TaxID=270496 RepID=UPI00040508FD|nr:SagB family peptide dehydrogenase [Fundidesulfovibrio putealis]